MGRPTTTRRRPRLAPTGAARRSRKSPRNRAASRPRRLGANDMSVYTVSWGYVPADTVRTVRCPNCQERVVGRLGCDGRRIELPNHGFTSVLECAGGWYQLVLE